MVNSEYLAKFKKLYEDKYNIELTDEQNTELATHFLNLMQILIKPKAKPEPIPVDTQENPINTVESPAYLEGGCE